MKVTCPNCQRSGQIDDKWHNKKVNCPNCKQIFVAGDQEPPNTPETPQTQDQATCSQCNNVLPKDNLMDFDGVLVCGACKVTYLQKMREGAVGGGPRGGGNLEDALAGNYDFQIMDVIKEAWAKTNGAKGSIWGGLLLAYAAIFVVTFLLMLPLGFMGAMGGGEGGMAAASGIISFLVQIVISALMLPAMLGLMMIGIRRSVDQPFSFKFCWLFFKWLVPLLIAYFLMMLMTGIGFVLLVIPGIYLAIAYIMAMPLVVEKDLKPWQALETSRKALGHKWFKIFGVYFLMGLIYMISAIPLGLGLIWTLPMFFVLQGILYRTIFGVGPATEQI